MVNTRPFLKGMGLALTVIVPILVLTASSASDPTAAGERAGQLSVAPLLGGVAVGVWALANNAQDRIIIVSVAKGLGDDERAFRSMTRAVGMSIGAQTVRTLEYVVRWDRTVHEFRHGVHLSNGLYVKTRCLPSSSTWNAPYINPSYIVCVQTLSPDSIDLDNARLHLKVPLKDPLWR
ncbi:MAG TPA: hypothetical protein VGJ83_00220 [Gemmatimonadales bacterium]|jgi:hypothetical protein